jgi:hypothetical protein
VFAALFAALTLAFTTAPFATARRAFSAVAATF